MRGKHGNDNLSVVCFSRRDKLLGFQSPDRAKSRHVELTSFDTVLARRAQCVLSFSRFEWADLENQDLDKRVIAPFQRVSAAPFCLCEQGLRSLKKVMRMSVSARSFSWPENEYDNEYERSE